MKKDKKILIICIFISLGLTGLVWILDDIFNLVPNVYLAPDTGASHYFWKLVPSDVSFLTRGLVWGLYLLHQISALYLVYKVSKQKVSDKLSKYNWALLGTTLFFIVAHMLQTYITYDGLAQDVSVFSSQGSVIVMLVLILIMGNRTRGLFFGKKAKLPKKGENLVHKYHGLFITWAIIYTFWYHPVISTPGHLFGFFYMFLLMIQMSFAGTKVHMNKHWGVLLEVLVFFHGTTVAILQQNGMWPMFAFGFAFMFVVTQVHTFKLKKAHYLLIYLTYIVAALLTYNNVTGIKEITTIHQIVWIPFIEYLLVFVIAYLLSIGKIIKKDI